MTERDPSTPPGTANPAEIYEQVVVRNFLPWTQDIIDRASPMNGEKVLDLACGTGIVARKVAPLVGADGSVAALDISPGMLEVGRRTADAEGLHIEWHEGNGTDLPFPAGSFNLVVCQQGLQFFPDHLAGLKEIRRVLRDGGRTVVTTWCGNDRNPFGKMLREVVAKHIPVPDQSAATALADSRLLERLAREAGFQNVAVEQVRLMMHVEHGQEYAGMMLQAAAAVLPEFKELDPKARQEVFARMRPDLDLGVQPFVQGSELHYEAETNVLTAAG